MTATNQDDSHTTRNYTTDNHPRDGTVPLHRSGGNGGQRYEAKHHLGIMVGQQLVEQNQLCLQIESKTRTPFRSVRAKPLERRQRQREIETETETQRERERERERGTREREAENSPAAATCSSARTCPRGSDAPCAAACQTPSTRNGRPVRPDGEDDEDDGR